MPLNDLSRNDDDATARSRGIRRITLTAIATNFSLVIGQIAVGLFANAFSLLADAAHTLSDLMTDLMVLLAGQQGANPADLDHPYGHGRIETVATLLLGAMLIAVGVGFLWASGMRLQAMGGPSGSIPPLHPAALVMAFVALAAKETLFRFTLAFARRLKAPLLEANAWHARSDAASSLVVAVGIGGSLLGFPFLEPLAAALVGFLIMGIGSRQVWRAVRELIDTGLSPEELARLRQTISDTPGVIGLHELRTRRMAHCVLCDAHVQVDPRITVSEGHYISDSVSLAARVQHSEISEVLVHVDTEDDAPIQPRAGRLPGRAAVLADMSALIAGEGEDEDEGEGEAAPFQRLQVHYIAGQVEVEVYFPPREAASSLTTLRQRTSVWLSTRPDYRAIHYYVQIAPE